MKRASLPFSSMVAQEAMKSALLLNAVLPSIGGVLIRGERGTGKSTAVRALAGLLPPRAVVSGCRFGCDPNDAVRLCSECVTRVRAGERLTAVERAMSVVELPANASEDRVVGSIDVEAGITRGETRFEPGVLARANRNVLYVDEVNLLDDHIVDVLLDAAAMGVNNVEREGISISHPARFILVGTMNPDEGELRPQLLDRFGLCVDVRSVFDVESRIAIMQSTATEDAAAADRRLAEIITRAQEIVDLVAIDDRGRALIAHLCVAAAVVGHRADLVIARTARALCAWREAEAFVGSRREPSMDALSVTEGDIISAAEFALAHRRRDAGHQRSHAQRPDSPKRHQQSLSQPADETGEQQIAAQSPAESKDAGEQAGAAEGEVASSLSRRNERGQASPGIASGQLYSGDLFSVRNLNLPRDRRTRRGRGKRAPTIAQDNRGRYVRSRQRHHVTDIAIDATLRAAAPHQSSRRKQGEAGLIVERQDLRQKVRRRKTGSLIVFVVDASASMDAEQRMQATKGAVLSLLRDAYLRRDKVAVVVFSGRSARVVLAPTSSVDLARSRLERLGVGGTTPLTHGLVAGLGVVRTEKLRDPTVRPLLVLISDGRGNISLFGDEPILEAQQIADQLGVEGIRTLIVDSARDHVTGMTHTYGVNTCKELARRSKGDYLGLFDLSQGAILAGVQQSLRGG